MKQKLLFTVVTSTYNRCENLKKLFRSLKKQKVYNFLWMVIDDCSTDSTRDEISKFIKESPFPIVYFLQKHQGGKHRALNLAFQNIRTELFIIIDSDDYFVSNGSVLIKEAWDKYKNRNIKSIVMERGANGLNDPILKIKKSGVIDSRYDYMMRNNMIGDFSDVFVTKAVKEYRFPEFPGELFISEGPLYYWFAKIHNYKSVFIDQVLTVGSYLKGGLTNHVRSLQIKNWHGTLFELNFYITKNNPLKQRIKKAILFDYILLEIKRPLPANQPNKCILLFCKLPAYIYYLIRKVKDENKK